MSKLITDRSTRFKTFDQFRSHPWFAGIDWDNIREQTPPYQPSFDGPDDTCNFDISDLKQSNNHNNQGALALANKDANLELAFVGFSATFCSQKKVNNGDQQVNGVQDSPKSSPVKSMMSFEEGKSERSEDEVSEDVATLERRLKAAQSEWSEMSHLLTEMKKDKNILSEQLRLKEQELDEQIEKNSQLRRNCEKIKRAQGEELATVQGELDSQKLLRKQGKSVLLLEFYEIHEFLIICRSNCTSRRRRAHRSVGEATQARQRIQSIVVERKANVHVTNQRPRAPAAHAGSCQHSTSHHQQ